MAFSSGFLPVFVLTISVIVSSIYYLIIFSSSSLTATQYEIGTSAYLSQQSLLLIRLCFGIVVWSTCLFLYLDKVGLHVSVLTRDVVYEMHLKHGHRFTPFTVWCWTLQGFYFLGAIICTASISELSTSTSNFHYVVSTSICKLTHILFEVSFAMSFLVSFVVSFVLIPGSRSRNMPTTNFFQVLPLIFHNCNVAFMVVEKLVNNIHIVNEDYPYILIFGLLYVIFSWYWFSVKKVFYYFFLDYDRPYSVFWYLGLLIVVSIFFQLGVFISKLQVCFCICLFKYTTCFLTYLLTFSLNFFLLLSLSISSSLLIRSLTRTHDIHMLNTAIDECLLHRRDRAVHMCHHDD